MSKIRGKIAGADEEAIDANDSRDGFDLRERSSALQLHQDAGVEVRIRMIALDTPVVVGALCDRDSTDAKRRITSCGDCLARFLSVLDKRNEKGASAGIESPLEITASFHGTRKTGSAVPAHCLQLCEQR